MTSSYFGFQLKKYIHVTLYQTLSQCKMEKKFEITRFLDNLSCLSIKYNFKVSVYYPGSQSAKITDPPIKVSLSFVYRTVQKKR